MFSRRHDFTGALQPFLYFPFFFLVSDGLTAGLKWEKGQLLYFASVPIVFLSISAYCCLLAGWALSSWKYGMERLHFAWLVFSSLPLVFLCFCFVFCLSRIDQHDSRKDSFLPLIPLSIAFCADPSCVLRSFVRMSYSVVVLSTASWSGSSAARTNLL